MSWQLRNWALYILMFLCILQNAGATDAQSKAVLENSAKRRSVSSFEIAHHASAPSPTMELPHIGVAAFQKISTTPSDTSAVAKPWDAPDWKKCAATFKRTAKSSMYPEEKRLVDGKCIGSTLPTKLPDGACFMEVVSPSDLLSATKFETKLMCMKGKVPEMVCTDKKGHYMDAMTGGMIRDKRCDGFPNLLATDMRKKGPNKAMQEIFKDTKPNSAECERQVRTIRSLENNSRFDVDRSIRTRWAREVELGTQMRCQF